MNRRRLLLQGTSLCLTAGFTARVFATAAGNAGASSMASGELARAQARGELCSAVNATGTGLRGEYFENASGVGRPLLVRVDAGIDFDRSLDWPTQGAGRRPASVRWTGWIKPPVSGAYRFHASGETVRFTVSHQSFVTNAGQEPASIELAAGRFFPVVLVATNLAALESRLRFEWTTPYGARYVVPKALLFEPSDSVSKPVGR